MITSRMLDLLNLTSKVFAELIKFYLSIYSIFPSSCEYIRLLSNDLPYVVKERTAFLLPIISSQSKYSKYILISFISYYFYYSSILVTSHVSIHNSFNCFVSFIHKLLLLLK
jgi:hypothetical protein